MYLPKLYLPLFFALYLPSEDAVDIDRCTEMPHDIRQITTELQDLINCSPAVARQKVVASAVNGS